MADKAIPPGGLILVTGVNGYIASHIADQLLGLGYRIRGTVRDLKKLQPLMETFRARHPSLSFEAVVIEDFLNKEAVENAMKGCDGIIHIPTVASFSPDPNVVVTPVVQGLLNVLEAASNEPQMKRFVWISSEVAVGRVIPNKRYHVDSNSWNEKDSKDAWAPPPYEPSRATATYSASKTEAERAAWNFVKTKQPAFIFNCVLPSVTLGPRLNSSQPGSTSGWVRALRERDPFFTELLHQPGPSRGVDVRDVARAHVGALLEDDVRNERILAHGEPYNYSRLTELLRDIDPSRQDYPPPHENESHDLRTVDTARFVELLRRYGSDGPIGFEQSLRDQFNGP